MLYTQAIEQIYIRAISVLPEDDASVSQEILEEIISICCQHIPLSRRVALEKEAREQRDRHYKEKG